MKTELRGRQIIAMGMENVVLRPASDDLNIVLKVSRPFNYLSMVGGSQAEVLRQELKEAQTLVADTQIRIPRTLIYEGRERRMLGIRTKGYVIGQEYIAEDRTVVDVEKHLSDQKLPSLVDEYTHEPRNFIASGGFVYWIDPTNGTIGRVLKNTGIMKLEDYRKLRRRLSRLIRFFGL